MTTKSKKPKHNKSKYEAKPVERYRYTDYDAAVCRVKSSGGYRILRRNLGAI